MKRRLVPDFTLLALALALSIFGLAMVYSAGQTDVLTRVTTLWHRQLLWVAIGLVAAFLASRASVRMLDWVTPPLYGVTCVVLLLLIFIGKGFGTGASTKSWLAIGGFRLGQPSEIAKIVVVLMLAKVLAARRDAPKSLLDLWQPALVGGGPRVLVMGAPDPGKRPRRRRYAAVCRPGLGRPGGGGGLPWFVVLAPPGRGRGLFFLGFFFGV